MSDKAPRSVSIFVLREYFVSGIANDDNTIMIKWPCDDHSGMLSI